MIRTGAVTICMLLYLVGLQAAEIYTPVGFIQSFSGKVLLCKSRPCTDQRAEPLIPGNDEGRILFENQSLKCQGNATVRVHTTIPISDVRKSEFAPDVCRKDEWRDMPVLKPQDRISTTQSFDYALKQYGRRAGREKGSDTPIYSPPDQSAVAAGDFVIRWRTRPPVARAAVSLKNARGMVLAQVPDVDGSAGMLDSPSLREALASYRNSADPDHPVTLVFKTVEAETGVSFSVLSINQEDELRNRLAQIDPSHGLFQHVERAAVYESLRMYDKVAAEYDSALKEAPASRDMLQAAFNAHARTGNLRRARELRDKLEEVDAQQQRP